MTEPITVYEKLEDGERVKATVDMADSGETKLFGDVNVHGDFPIDVGPDEDITIDLDSPHEIDVEHSTLKVMRLGLYRGDGGELRTRGYTMNATAGGGEVIELEVMD